MGHSTTGTAAREARPARQQQPGTVRLAGMLTLSCLIRQTGQTTVTFAGELDTASADQACEYVRHVIDAHGGQVLLDMAGLSFCDARGLGALARMSGHARQAGSSLHLVAGGMSQQTGPAAARPGPWSLSSCRPPPVGRTQWTCCCAVTTSGSAGRLDRCRRRGLRQHGALIAGGVGEYEHGVREHATAI